MSADERKEREPVLYVLNAEPGENRVTLNLITSISTSANATFDKLAEGFRKRISEKAAEIFVPANEDKKAP